MPSSVRPGVAVCEGAGDAPFAHMAHRRNRPKRLAKKLLQIREALGLSQKEMAERLADRTGFKITQTHVSNYECDRVEPFLETTLAYARLANVEMNEIADDDVDLNI
jgi:transcriptional regulator with XRE-family HTH domain